MDGRRPRGTSARSTAGPGLTPGHRRRRELGPGRGPRRGAGRRRPGGRGVVRPSSPRSTRSWRARPRRPHVELGPAGQDGRVLAPAHGPRDGRAPLGRAGRHRPARAAREQAGGGRHRGRGARHLPGRRPPRWLAPTDVAGVAQLVATDVVRSGTSGCAARAHRPARHRHAPRRRPAPGAGRTPPARPATSPSPCGAGCASTSWRPPATSGPAQGAARRLKSNFAGGDQRNNFAGGDQRDNFAGGDQRDNSRASSRSAWSSSRRRSRWVSASIFSIR